MSEELCVCGHSKAQHCQPVQIRTGHGGQQTGSYVYTACQVEGCKCGYIAEIQGYRAVLPWPDSEGWWWRDYKDDCDLVIAYETKPGEFIISSTDDDCDHEGHQRRHGPARFVKLTEQSPFIQPVKRLRRDDEETRKC